MSFTAETYGNFVSSSGGAACQERLFLQNMSSRNDFDYTIIGSGMGEEYLLMILETNLESLLEYLLLRLDLLFIRSMCRTFIVSLIIDSQSIFDAILLYNFYTGDKRK